MHEWLPTENPLAVVLYASWVVLGWVTSQWLIERSARHTSDNQRNTEALAAARELYEQKVLNIKSESAIEFRDWRIAELTRDRERCEETLARALEQRQGRQEAGE